MASREPIPVVFHFGAYEIDAAEGELRKGGIPLKLHPQPFRVLLLLVERGGEVVSREEIQKCLWGQNQFVDFDGGINFCIRQIRAALADDAESPQYIETLPRKGYRFIYPLPKARPGERVVAISRAEMLLGRPIGTAKADDTPGLRLPKAVVPSTVAKSHRAGTTLAATCALVLVALASFLYLHRPPKLTERDTVVLADFDNSTGDPVFDGALKQALTVELAQSPFLNLLPDKSTSETLSMMGQSPGGHVTRKSAEEICVRTGSKALVAGAVSSLGSHYLLNLNAVACSTGQVLASEQADAAKKEDVLKAVSHATATLRAKLGESLPSVQKYDVPIEATTTSLEALRSLSIAARVGATEGDAASIPFVEQALQYDPDFAMAYVALARRYNNLNQPLLSLENAAKAYQLRDHVTEREKLEISASYFRATGDLESLNKILELWKVEYPRDNGPHGRLCANYEFIGQYEQALPECQEALRLDANNIVGYGNLSEVYLNLNRYDEAQQTCDEALSRGIVCAGLYDLDFIRGDSAGMEREVSSATGKPGYEDALLSAHSNTKAYYGQLQQARDLSRRAAELALRSGLSEAASLWRVNAAVREAEFGDAAEAKRGVIEALRLAPSRNTKVLGAIALARIGEISQARALEKELEQSDPSNTLLKIYWFPVMDTAIELKQGNLSKAFATLEALAPYELAQPSPNEIGTLYPLYLRGQAYLMTHNGRAAAVEFQKILDHRGIVVNFVTGALAHLGLARAVALQGDTAKARTAYEDFFTLWEDADQDIPILKQAKTEYAKLR
jgi:DNA-binding winged helix-turn-helix (wHTH) protein/tetratricopeptide (TPR) repeat protein